MNNGGPRPAVFVFGDAQSVARYADSIHGPHRFHPAEAGCYFLEPPTAAKCDLRRRRRRQLEFGAPRDRSGRIA